MKKRKSMIMLAVLVAVLVLGVGYAAIAGVQLDITGTAAVENRDLKVAFNGTVTPNAGDTGATVTGTAANNSLSGTIAVTGLSAVGQKVSVTYTIKNDEEDVNATVALKTLNFSQSDFFEVTTSVDDDEITVPAGGTNTVTVYVELIGTPITTAQSSTDITIELEAEPVDPLNP